MTLIETITNGVSGLEGRETGSGIGLGAPTVYKEEVVTTIHETDRFHLMVCMHDSLS